MKLTRPDPDHCNEYDTVEQENDSGLYPVKSVVLIVLRRKDSGKRLNEDRTTSLIEIERLKC